MRLHLSPWRCSCTASKRRHTLAWASPKRFIRPLKRAAPYSTSCHSRSVQTTTLLSTLTSGTSTRWTPTGLLAQDKLASRNAHEVIRRGVLPDGNVTTPMRNAEAQLTLAVIAARRGETDDAATLGIEALQNGRQSRPSLLMVTSELEHELDTYGQRVGSDFRELFDEIKRPS
jgi:hypothetical protein